MQKNYFLIGLVIFIFAAISFSTNMIGPLDVPISKSFGLSGFESGLIPLSFFIAYLISIPAAILNERIKEKKAMTIAFLFAGSGALIFAAAPQYILTLPSFFMIGLGMAMLQVIINPLLRTAGGEENFAFYSVVAQIVFGGVAAAIPYLSGYFQEMAANGNSLFPVDTNIPWIINYQIIALLLLSLGIIMFFIKLPAVELKEDEKAAGKELYFELLKDKKVWVFFFAIFAYVGTEQGVAIKIKDFLMQYHQLSADEGDTVIFWYWMLLTLGCILGIVLVKLYDCRILLRYFVFAAMFSLALALFAPANISYYAFMMVGFFLSVMWSINFSLGLNSFAKNHGAIAGILCTGVIGGAIAPFIIGTLKDMIGLQLAMCFNFVLLLYILWISFWAKPLVNNQTTALKDLFKKK
jgi:fucose permease